MMRVLKLAQALMLTLGLSSSAVYGEVIAGNFGPGDSYQTGTGNSWGTGYPGLPASSDYAQNAIEFTNSTGTTYVLDQFRFAANYYDGENSITASFYGGSSDLNSATLLESFTFSAPTQFDSYIFTAVSSLHPVIQAGETYFIALSVLRDPAVGTLWGWQWNDQNQQGNWWTKSDDFPWFTQSSVTPVFDVSATAVPEPSSILLGMIGLVSSIGVIRYRHAA